MTGVVPAVFGAAAGLAGLLLVFLGVSIYTAKPTKKRYEEAVARVAASFRGLTNVSKGRAAYDMS